jgi:hypothetical protein
VESKGMDKEDDLGEVVKNVVCFPSIFQLETRWKTQNFSTTFQFEVKNSKES